MFRFLTEALFAIVFCQIFRLWRVIQFFFKGFAVFGEVVVAVGLFAVHFQNFSLQVFDDVLKVPIGDIAAARNKKQVSADDFLNQFFGRLYIAIRVMKMLMKDLKEEVCCHMLFYRQVDGKLNESDEFN